MPVLMLNTSKGLTMNNWEFAADLARSVALAGTHLDKGYQLRYRESMIKALEIQRELLSDREPVEFDPRDEPNLEDHVHGLLGIERWYSDFGFGDYQVIMAELLTGQLSPEQREAAQEALEDVEAFVIQRHINLPLIHNVNIRAHGFSAYGLRKTRDERARETAQVLAVGYMDLVRELWEGGLYNDTDGEFE
jgi:hypothetical protein